MRFVELFLNLLRTQLILKGIMSEEDWNNISPDIGFIFNQDSHFSELKHTEILKERLDLLSQMDEYIGKYYSTEWIRRNILKQSDEDIQMIDAQIQQEGPQEGEEDMEGEF